METNSSPATPSEEDIRDLCVAIWDLLYEQDLDEDARSQAIAALHETISEEMYLAVWERLDAQFRRGWKEYVRHGLDLRKALNRRPDILGRI